MRHLLKSLLNTIAVASTASILFVTGAIAQDARKPEDLRFSRLSTQGSAPLWYPAWVAFDIATRIDDRTRVRGSSSGLERVPTESEIDNLRLEFGWELGGGSSAASSAASSSAFGNFTAFIVAGILLASHDVEYFVSPGGSAFPTDGDEDFKGIYTGLNVNLLGEPATSSAATSSAAALMWNAFFNLGWGRGEVDGFGGSFQRSDTGLFWEAGTSLQVDLGGIYFGPVLSYLHFDQSDVKLENTVLGLRFTIPLE